MKRDFVKYSDGAFEEIEESKNYPNGIIWPVYDLERPKDEQLVKDMFAAIDIDDKWHEYAPAIIPFLQKIRSET